jgi:hypothetical protein
MAERIHSPRLATAAIAATLLAACATPTASDPEPDAVVEMMTYSCPDGSAYSTFTRNQAPDGSYSDSSDLSSEHTDIETTCLMSLSLLGDGNTMRSGAKKTLVKKAIRWLVKAQRPDGTFAATATGTASNDNMFEHGLATYTLVEAAGLSDYHLLWKYAEPAVKTLLAHRNDDGGWSGDQYQGHSDALATAWCALACMSAKHFGHAAHEQPSNENLMVWFDRHPATTIEHAASELFCRSFAGQTSPDLVRRVLAEASVTDPDECFWASTALYLVGGPSWKAWETKTNDLQSTRIDNLDSQHFGGFPPAGRRGPIATTALRVLALQAHYRYSRLIRLSRSPQSR